MSAVDPGYAGWLKAAALYTSAFDSAVVSAFGVLAVEQEIVSPLALLADADDEVARQLAFVGGAPMVVDRLSVPGLRADLHGQCVTLVADRGAYGGAGLPCFVIGVDESETVERTDLTVLRKL